MKLIVIGIAFLIALFFNALIFFGIIQVPTSFLVFLMRLMEFVGMWFFVKLGLEYFSPKIAYIITSFGTMTFSLILLFTENIVHGVIAVITSLIVFVLYP